jgi:hypothetical protein
MWNRTAGLAFGGKPSDGAGHHAVPPLPSEPADIHRTRGYRFCFRVVGSVLIWTLAPFRIFGYSIWDRPSGNRED